MANIKISELNELYGHQRAYDDYIPVVDASADETKKISVKSLIPNNVYLIAVTDTAPVEYETGDKYYNTEENKIYTALSTGWGNAETPIGGILYIILSEQKSYTYDGDNETLISVGGGGGGGIAVYPDEPEEDTKLYIESTDLDFQGLEISDEYTTGDNVAYSADYVNTLETYSTTEQRVGTWIDGKPLYRKIFITTNTNTTSNWKEYNFSEYGLSNDVDYLIFPKAYKSKTQSNSTIYEDLENDGMVLQINSTTKKISIKGNGNTYNNYTFIYEYTKTTD